jgi:hypothetical protein
MKITCRHNLDYETAYQRINDLAAKIQEDYKEKISEKTVSWNENKTEMSFQFLAVGLKVKGSIYLLDGEVLIESNVPWQVKPFQGRLESKLKNELEKILS